MISLIKTITAAFLHYSGLNSLYRSVFHKDKCLILMYHRVMDGDHNGLHPGMFVTKSTFEKHIAYLKEKYSVITFDEMIRWKQGLLVFDKTPCVVTLDDGWRDNYTNAYPILKQYKCPATIFVITNEIGSDNMLSRDQINEMVQNEIDFGSHTDTHRELQALQKDVLSKELETSRDKLKGMIINPSCVFCFPRGKYDKDSYSEVKKHYCAALTTNRGFVSKEDDLFLLNRIGVHNDVAKNVSLFACRLGVFNL
jgi:peptidoglycan/xylan/chitin deacetylase (PgdA/CDA1 family)